MLEKGKTLNKKSLVVAGTYEKLLYGLNFEEKTSRVSLGNNEATDGEAMGDERNNEDGHDAEEPKDDLPSGGEELIPSFIYPTHLSSISCLSMGHSKFLATGSSDENIKLYDLKLRKEIGNLMIHTDTITRLHFIGKSHLISSSRDGTIGITRTSDWELLKKLKGHNGPVFDFSVHSSGKVLLSVGQDSTLKCWDLSRGLLSYSMKLSIMPTMVRWSSCGSKYLVFSNYQISIYSILQSGNENSESPIVAKIKSKSRINCGVCMKMVLKTISMENDQIDVVIYGGEDKILRIAEVSTGRILINVATKHQLRIKDMAELPVLKQVTTCSSEGLIQIWDLEKLAKKIDMNSKEDSTILIDADECADAVIGYYDCKCRVTCIAFIHGDTGEDKRQAIEKEREAQAERLAKLNEMPESDYETDIKNLKEKKVLIAFDSDNTLQIPSESSPSGHDRKLREKAPGKVTQILSEKKLGGVSKKKKMRTKPKIQRESF